MDKKSESTSFKMYSRKSIIVPFCGIWVFFAVVSAAYFDTDIPRQIVHSQTAFRYIRVGQNQSADADTILSIPHEKNGSEKDRWTIGNKAVAGTEIVLFINTFGCPNEKLSTY